MMIFYGNNFPGPQAAFFCTVSYSWGMPEPLSLFDDLTPPNSPQDSPRNPSSDSSSENISGCPAGDEVLQTPRQAGKAANPSARKNPARESGRKKRASAANKNPRQTPISPDQDADNLTFGVRQLNETVKEALERAFPSEVWVRGEIKGFARTAGRRHRYFELVEKEEGSAQVSASLAVALLAWDRPALEVAMAVAPDFRLDDDIEVRVRGRIDFYPPYGKLQFRMTGVDPAFTLGRMAAGRERTLGRLAQEGLLERNTCLSLPSLPLRIGLVTSVGSAAYEDFLHELQQSGFGFQVQVCDARVQGQQAVPMILQALDFFAQQLGTPRAPDLVVLVRGGGARSDLVWFDDEAIARAIALLPVPVMTGIGHEIDTSVADRVAHTACKTPTACAAFIVGQVEEAIGQVREVWQQVQQSATQELAHATKRTDDTAGQLVLGGRRRVDRARRLLAARGNKLHHLVAVRLTAEEARLDFVCERLALSRFRTFFNRCRLLLEQRGDRLTREAHRSVRRAAIMLECHDATVRAGDVRRFLARGLALLRNEDGKAIQSITEVEAGMVVRAIVQDGTLDTLVTGKQARTETGSSAIRAADTTTETEERV